MIKKFFPMAAAAIFLLTSASCGRVIKTASIDDTTPTKLTTTEPPTSDATTSAPAVTTPVTTEPVTDVKAPKGNIYDCNGQLLLTNENIGSTVRRLSTADYAVSFANILTTMSDGYDTAFEEILTSGDTSVGQSIQLTLDANVQNSVYKYMESMNIKGSVVVMRTDGSILSQVSYPSYDPNVLSSQEYDENLAWGEYGNKAFQNFEPGSCFKIMSEVIADKHGVTVLYDEGEWKYDDTSIVNWDHDTNFSYPISERTLTSAFVNSSNIFFAKAFDRIGTEDVLNDLDNIFHFVTDIECDFGDLSNNVEINCADDLRRTAFGQSYVLTCPIYLAALGREAVFGDMVRPFVLKSVVDTDSPSTVIAQGSRPGEVIASIPAEYRQNLLDGMLNVASNLGVSVPGYTLYAKTGTAETWEGDFLYITGCLKNNNDDGSQVYSDYSGYKDSGSYVIVMQVRNPEEHGFKFASESSRLYQGVIETILNS